MKKRILSILLTLVMVIGMLPTVAFAAGNTVTGLAWDGTTAKFDALDGAISYTVTLYKGDTALYGTRTTSTSVDFGTVMSYKGDGDYKFTVTTNVNDDNHQTKSTSSVISYNGSHLKSGESTLISKLSIGGKTYFTRPEYSPRLETTLSGEGWTYSESGTDFTITLTSAYNGEPIYVENANGIIRTDAGTGSNFVAKANGIIIIDGDVKITSSENSAIQFKDCGHMEIKGAGTASKLTLNSTSAPALDNIFPLSDADWAVRSQPWLNIKNIDLDIAVDDVGNAAIKNGMSATGQPNGMKFDAADVSITAKNSRDSDVYGIYTNNLYLHNDAELNIDLDKGTPLFAEKLNSSFTDFSGTISNDEYLTCEYKYEYSVDGTDLELVPNKETVIFLSFFLSFILHQKGRSIYERNNKSDRYDTGRIRTVARFSGNRRYTTRILFFKSRSIRKG